MFNSLIVISIVTITCTADAWQSKDLKASDHLLTAQGPWIK